MNPAAFVTMPSVSSLDGEQPHPFDFGSHLKVYLVNIYAAAAMRAIAQDVAATPLLVQQYKTVKGTQQWVTIENGPLYDLLNNPNPNEAFDHITERFMLGLLATGNSYLLYTPKFKELYYIRPDLVFVDTDKSGTVVSYTIKNAGLQYDPEVDELIHLKLANPSGDYYGAPLAEPIKETIMTKLSMNRYFTRFFQKNAMVGLILSTARGMEKDQRDKLKKEMNRLYGGVDASESSGSLILEGGMTATRLIPTIKEMIPDAIDNMVRHETYTAFGVPPFRMGDTLDASYANADKQDQIYQRNTVQGYRRAFASALNRQLVPIFGDDLRVMYDLSTVIGLQEDATIKSSRVGQQFRDNIITRDEARIDLGKPELGEGNGGEVYSYELSPFLPSPSIAESGGSSSAKRSLAPAILKLSAPPDENLRERIWKGHDIQLVKYETQLARKVTPYFDSQLDRLLQKIDDKTGNGSMRSILGVYVSKDVDPNLIRQIFDLDLENGLLKQQVGPTQANIVGEAGQAAIDALMIDIGFNVSNPQVAMMIETFKNRITFINNTSWLEIKRLITQAYQDGSSVVNLKDNIRELYQKWTDDTLENYRAMRIARTETNGMVNGGQVAGYEQVGIEKKQWISTRDDRTRDSHMAADGETVGVTEEFMVAGEMLEYPGDPSGSPENVINCRCAVVAAVD